MKIWSSWWFWIRVGFEVVFLLFAALDFVGLVDLGLGPR
jgi:hypothetical protein